MGFYIVLGMMLATVAALWGIVWYQERHGTPDNE
mgnify:CR=1 FL=1